MSPQVRLQPVQTHRRLLVLRLHQLPQLRAAPKSSIHIPLYSCLTPIAPSSLSAPWTVPLQWTVQLVFTGVNTRMSASGRKLLDVSPVHPLPKPYDSIQLVNVPSCMIRRTKCFSRMHRIAASTICAPGEESRWCKTALLGSTGTGTPISVIGPVKRAVCKLIEIRTSENLVGEVKLRK